MPEPSVTSLKLKSFVSKMKKILSKLLKTGNHFDANCSVYSVLHKSQPDTMLHIFLMDAQINLIYSQRILEMTTTYMYDIINFVGIHAFYCM